MSISSAQAVKELREMTGLGMMECKKILEEAGGDFAKAKDLVAKQGKTRKEKLSGRATTEGIIEIHVDGGKVGAMLELGCNTDFVARSEPFRGLAKDLAAFVAAKDPGSADILDQKSADGAKTIRDLVEELVATTKENVTIVRFTRFETGQKAAHGVIESYIHQGKVGALVELGSDSAAVAGSEEARLLAREIAMHIAATAPEVVSREDVDQTLIASIREHQLKELDDGKKPQAALEKIVEGKLRVWFEERVLLEQPWVKDASKTIGKLVEELAASSKAKVSVARFARFKVGETTPKTEEG